MVITCFKKIIYVCNMRVEIGVGRQLSGIKAHFKQSILRYMVQQKAPTPKSKVYGDSGA